ncbi:hypothetical protein Fmac_028547 [Flemingia macrophylla]|uniref:Uncharacterized protein n=1 Tax=Flemingia macrophylla TaxID=520843 RepID=A0ABD1L889_9FABA
MAPNSYRFKARNDAIVVRGVQDMATDTSAETRKLEGKLDVLVNLVTHLAANQKPTSIARVCGIRSSNDHHSSKAGWQARCSCELGDLASCKLEVCLCCKSLRRIRSSTDHQTSVRPSSRQSGVDEHPEAYVGNTYIADHHKEAETRHLIEKMVPNS